VARVPDPGTDPPVASHRADYRVLSGRVATPVGRYRGTVAGMAGMAGGQLRQGRRVVLPPRSRVTYELRDVDQARMTYRVVGYHRTASLARRAARAIDARDHHHHQIRRRSVPR